MSSDLSTSPFDWQIARTETLPVGVDVSANVLQGETITAPTATLTDLTTGDAAPAGALSGGVAVASGVLTQTLVGPYLTAGHAYRLVFTFSAGGKIWSTETLVECLFPTFTYNLATTIGRARLLIPDRNPESPIFTDEELGGFAAVEGDDPRLVAAAALETMAASDAYLFKKNRVEDLATDGPAVANALMKRAQALREQSQLEDDKGGGAFDWAEQVIDPFTARERLIDQRLRGVV